MKSKTANSEKLDRLLDDAIDDILNMSDEELIAAIDLDSSQIEDRVGILKQRVYTLISDQRRARMIAARESIDRQIESRTARFQKMSRDQMTETLVRALKRQEDGHLTMAARDGDGMSDEDMATYLEDLFELGVITEDDL